MDQARIQEAANLQRFCGESVTLLADLHQQIQGNVAGAMQGYWLAGQRLAALKEKLKGNFVEFLLHNRERLGFAKTMAYVYMQYYFRHAGNGPSPDHGSLRAVVLADRTPTGTHAGDVALKPARTGWAGIVNRFELAWKRWEDGGAAERDEAREVTRPMYEHLKRLHEGQGEDPR